MEENIIIKELKARANPENPDEALLTRLNNLLDRIIDETSGFTSRINTIFSEYDLHDESHSQKVLENISLLIGEEHIKKMPTFDLFILAASSYLHDCGMAPSDWELRVLDLADEETVPIEKRTLSDTMSIIKKRKNDTYKDWGKVSEWIFAEQNENKLIEYLATLYMEYQDFRNGYTDRYQKEDKCKVDEKCRLNYLRETHPARAAHYIGNMETLFKNILGENVTYNSLLKDIGKVAQAHGENFSYVKNLRKETTYIAGQSANLQFDAMMLRLGDIIHFSCDRAPLSLRTSKIFESEYSFKQWAIKEQQVTYSIANGNIAFTADCQNPEYYYTLLEQFDWMNREINQFNTIKSDWASNYQIDIKEIDSNQVRADNDVFTPKPNMKFTLEQDKIIELLMGANLYKNPYACLRELYQNSLDACRCMISKAKKDGYVNAIGKIEFGIEKDDGGKYVYCLDNGIGMTEEVIENHFLKIGCSYYKSQEFFRKQAEWGSSFTPTSQFGIGVLSCFMIAKKIEVITKDVDHKTSCFCVDGLHECFYYKPPQTLDKEKITTPTGTLMKLYLKEPFDTQLHNEKTDKLGLLLSAELYYSIPDEFSDYAELYKSWETHLYHILFDFIQIPPQSIEVNVRYEDDRTKEPIHPRPYGISTISPCDERFIISTTRKNYNKEIYKNTVYYPIVIDKEKEYGFTYHFIFALPKSISTDFHKRDFFYSVDKHICVDGISLSDEGMNFDTYTEELIQYGTINFVGANRPQLSVDRCSILSNHLEMEKASLEVLEELTKEVLSKTYQHIIEYNIDDNLETYKSIWNYICDDLFHKKTLCILINQLDDPCLGKFKYEPLSDMLSNEMTISEFLHAEHISYKRLLTHGISKFLNLLILKKSLSANKIYTSDFNTMEIDYLSITKPIPIYDFFYHSHLLPIVDKTVLNLFDDYDIISGLYPFISEYFYQLLNKKEYYAPFRATGFDTSFFYHDPLCVNQQIGFLKVPYSVYFVPENLYFNHHICRNYFSSVDIRYYAFSFIISAFIPPRGLSPAENSQIEKIMAQDKDYYKGVKEGWTILIWNNNNNNKNNDTRTLILPGKMTRQEMAKAFSQYVQSNQLSKEYLNYRFTNKSSVYDLIRDI